MLKPVRKTYTMSMYLDNIKDKDTRTDADVQRMAEQWDKNMINELIVTVLTDDYIPPIILGEEVNSQKWIIDGLQRSSSLMAYRYGHYKITSAIEDSIISYKAKVRDENGDIVEDKNGDIVWREVDFDIRNKTYDELPDELKKKFNEYQIETVIHENCDMKRISKLIKRYNNHISMNTNQKAFTYIDNYARDIRNIIDRRFFVDCGKYTEKERSKGVLERVVLESVMCMFHIDKWKKQTKQISIYLNEHAAKEEFDKLNNNLSRLEKIITRDLSDMFTSKDSFIWFTLFDKFTCLQITDNKFAEFLKVFNDEKSGLRNKIVNGKVYDLVDKNKGTKDKSVIMDKLNILEILMNDFLSNEKVIEIKNVDISGYIDEFNNVDIVKNCNITLKTDMVNIAVKTLMLLEDIYDLSDDSIQEYIKSERTNKGDLEDCMIYLESLNDWSVEVNNISPVFSLKYIPLLIKLVKYVYVNDIEEEEFINWFKIFADEFDVNRFNSNSYDNYDGILKDFKKYIMRHI